MSTTLNRCNVPAWIIASREFNDDPLPIELQGVRESNRFLFARLEGIEDARERAALFDDYMSVKFHLHEWQSQDTDLAKRAIKNSYLRFLRGWGVDSNSIEGAVLKGWVESRIGIPPCFHREPLPSVQFDDYTPYALDRMRGHARTNDIDGQLDLVYTYTQYEFSKTRSDQRWLKLYRGTYDSDEYNVTERLGRSEYYVRLNNLCSFTTDADLAWEFGTRVWVVSVPACKIFFHGDLLPRSILKGENEHLVIGGEFRVRELRH